MIIIINYILMRTIIIIIMINIIMRTDKIYFLQIAMGFSNGLTLLYTGAFLEEGGLGKQSVAQVLILSICMYLCVPVYV